jgi:SAM-dependent methyltransferase
VSRWEFPRLACDDAEALCAAGHPFPVFDLGSRSYQADYAEGMTRSGRSATLSRVLQMPLAGKRVLDIGCAEGAAALSAARMGAEVTGLEPRRSRMAKAERIAEATGTPIELHNVRLDDFTAPGSSFDVALALNVIHHVPDPFAFLDRAANLTSSHLVLEYPGLQDPKFGSTVSGLESVSAEQPLIGVSLPSQDQSFVFTPASLDRYLVHTLGAFKEHQVLASPIEGRWLSVLSGKRRRSGRNSSMAANIRLRRSLQQQRSEIDRLQQLVQAMEASRSWRLTAPLRRARSRTR